MLIDSHLHIGLNDWTEEHLLKYLDDHKIEKGWILTWEEQHPAVPDYYLPLDISMVKKAFKNHPDRIVPFYAPDPGRKNWKEDLQSCLDIGFSGCAELKVSYSWDDPIMTSLLEFLDSKKLPLIFHMERARNMFIPREDKGLDWVMKRLINERYNGKTTRLIEKVSSSTGLLKKYISKRLVEFPGYLLDMDALERAIGKFPGISFIGHGPHIWNHLSVPKKEHLFHQNVAFNGEGTTWRLLKEHSNFYCDISGFSGYNALSRDREISKKFLSECSNKLLYGTDNMDLGLFDLVESFGIEKEKLAHIYYKNARAIIG